MAKRVYALLIVGVITACNGSSGVLERHLDKTTRVVVTCARESFSLGKTEYVSNPGADQDHIRRLLLIHDAGWNSPVVTVPSGECSVGFYAGKQRQISVHVGQTFIVIRGHGENWINSIPDSAGSRLIGELRTVAFGQSRAANETP